jgi:hypothetical protein
MLQCENVYMDRYTLPHGAKGIEGEDFAVEVGADKLVFVPKSAGKGRHYTLHAGPDSGVIDLHETQPTPDGDGQRRTLFALQRDDLTSVFGEFAPMLPELLSLLRPLRLGWLKHNNIGIARGIDPVSDKDIAAVTRKRKRRLTLDAELYQQNVFVPEFLEEVYDFPDGNFTLLHRGRPIGIGFKKTDADGHVRLFWIKRRDLLRFGNGWSAKVIDALRRIAIPPENYPAYPFLR